MPWLYVLISPLYPDLYMDQPVLMGLVLSISFTRYIGARYHWSLAYFIGYCIFNYFALSTHGLADAPPTIELKAAFVSSFQIAYLLLYWIILESCKLDVTLVARPLLIFSLITTYVSSFFELPCRLIWNPSLNAAFSVWLLGPYGGWQLALLTLVQVVFMQSGASAFVLLLLVVSWHLRWKKLLLGAVSGVAYLSWSGIHAFVEPNRMAFYKAVWTYWREHANPLVGYSFGSYQATAYYIQQTMDYHREGLWLSVHSDWLQLLFELGFIGLALAIWLFVDLIRCSREFDRFLVVGFGIVALVFFPCQSPIWLFLMMAMCMKLLRRPMPYA